MGMIKQEGMNRYHTEHSKYRITVEVEVKKKPLAQHIYKNENESSK
jgi:hypothetical protein